MARHKERRQLTRWIEDLAADEKTQWRKVKTKLKGYAWAMHKDHSIEDLIGRASAISGMQKIYDNKCKTIKECQA